MLTVSSQITVKSRIGSALHRPAFRRVTCVALTLVSGFALLALNQHRPLLRRALFFEFLNCLEAGLDFFVDVVRQRTGLTEIGVDVKYDAFPRNEPHRSFHSGRRGSGTGRHHASALIWRRRRSLR